MLSSQVWFTCWLEEHLIHVSVLNSLNICHSLSKAGLNIYLPHQPQQESAALSALSALVISCHQCK